MVGIQINTKLLADRQFLWQASSERLPRWITPGRVRVLWQTGRQMESTVAIVRKPSFPKYDHRLGKRDFPGSNVGRRQQQNLQITCTVCALLAASDHRKVNAQSGLRIK